MTPRPPAVQAKRDHACRLYRAGASLRQAGEASGLPWATVRHALLEAGVQLRSPGRPAFGRPRLDARTWGVTIPVGSL